MPLHAFEAFLNFYYPCLLTTGLVADLPRFKSEDPEVQAVVQQLYEALTGGKDWESALRGLSPALPEVLTELLIAGAAQARLDHVIAEMLTHYQEHTDEAELYQALSQQLAHLEVGPRPALICQNCLVQSFEKLLARAALEKAQRVLLKQTGHSFFEQAYLGSKLVQVREASHAHTYRSLWQLLNRACQQHSFPGEGWMQAYTVHPLEPSSFCISSAHQTLVCVFLTPLSDLPA